MTISRKQLAALNAAGEALRALDLGAVRLRYRPADNYIPNDSFSVWLDDCNAVGLGPTPETALFDALAKRDATREAA